MKERYIFEKAVDDCIESVRDAGADPTTIIAEENGLWFKENQDIGIQLLQKYSDGGIETVLSSDATERVYVIGEFDSGRKHIESVHFDMYRRVE